MSAFILPTSEIDQIISTAAHLTDHTGQPYAEVFRFAFGHLGYQLDTAADWQRLAIALHQINVQAVNERYTETTAADDYAPQITAENATSPEEFHSSLRCLIYNSAEGTVPTLPLFLALETTRPLVEEITTEHTQHIRNQARLQRQQIRTDHIAAGRQMLDTMRPAGTTHAIIAQLRRDDSDSQSDYFASSVQDVVVLAWSTHGRDLFSEMRKAAAKCPHTQHLGPGCDEYSPRIVSSHNYVDCSGYHVFKGSTSKWHSELEDRDTAHGWPTFSTKAAAQAWIDSRPAHSLDVQTYDAQSNEITVQHEWEIQHHTVEHREKWSMGRGYYLAAGSSYSGWQVSKTSAEDAVVLEALGKGQHTLDTPKAAVKITPEQVAIVRPEWDKMKEFIGLPPDTNTAPTVAAADAVTITENTEKQGVEIRFPAKPPAFLLESLKALGWRWSRFSGCWYAKATAEARTFAQTIAATWDTSQPA